MRILPMFAVLAAAAVVCSVRAPAHASDPVLERGRYLVRGVAACGNCHTPQTPDGPDQSRELAGGPPLVEPGVFKVFAPNITPDPETGIGAWSDEEIVRAVREGKRPDGRTLGPPMPYRLYRSISDEDMRAIVAHLRSVPAVRQETPPPEYGFPLPPSYGPPAVPVAAVTRDDPVAYGAYLAGPVGHCIECHSTPVQGVPDIENSLGAGGMTFVGPWGESVSANITPTGLGDWSDAEIVTAVTTGVRPDGRRLLPPMGYGYYATITQADLTAIVAYLRTLPPQ